MSFKIKRAYEKPARTDGVRVLVDRIWPRGVSKADAKIDQWRKEIAPSTALRKWFGHDPARWAEFKRRYFAELGTQGDALDELRKLARRENCDAGLWGERHGAQPGCGVEGIPRGTSLRPINWPAHSAREWA